MQRNRSAIALLAASVIGASCLAYAQLGGSGGVRVPYQGRLELDGNPADGLHDFRFSIFNAGSGGNACDTHEEAAIVNAGAFSVVIGPVSENCIRGQDVFVGVEVSQDANNDGYIALPGRQQVLAAPAAATSGSGDFHIEGDAFVEGTLTVPGTIVGGTIDGTTVNGATISGTTVSGTTVNATSVNTTNLSVGGVNLANNLGARVIAAGATGSNGSNFGAQSVTTGASGRGVLVISASGYGGASSVLTLNVLINGALFHTMQTYTNEAGSHKAFPTSFLPVDSTIPFGGFVMNVVEGSGTSIDSNDRLNVLFIETL